MNNKNRIVMVISIIIMAAMSTILTEIILQLAEFFLGYFLIGYGTMGGINRCFYYPYYAYLRFGHWVSVPWLVLYGFLLIKMILIPKESIIFIFCLSILSWLLNLLVTIVQVWALTLLFIPPGIPKDTVFPAEGFQLTITLICYLFLPAVMCILTLFLSRRRKIKMPEQKSSSD